MIIPHLHFKGNCRSAIDLYEKAFGAEVETIVTSREYGSSKPNEENLISHATMRIHGQQIFLNDRFGNSDNNTDIAVHLIIMFDDKESFMSCYGILKDDSVIIDPLETLPYSELNVQFIDKFGVQWGFMINLIK